LKLKVIQYNVWRSYSKYTYEKYVEQVILPELNK